MFDWLTNIFGGGGENQSSNKSITQREYVALPDYPESTTARQTMAGKLDAWGNDPNYGGVPQEWDKMWNLASQKTHDYYWGTPTSPGAIGKLTANAVRTGQSDQPGYMRSLANLQKEEGKELTNMSTQQAIEQAKFAELARDKYATNVWNMMGLTPNYQVGTQVTDTILPDTQSEDFMASLFGGSFGNDLMGNLGKIDWSKLFGGGNNNAAPAGQATIADTSGWGQYTGDLVSAGGGNSAGSYSSGINNYGENWGNLTDSLYYA